LDRSLESFRLIEALYKGSASLVYLAEDKITGQSVILKLYRKNKLSILNRFQVEREVKLHLDLNHDSIIKLVW